MATRVGSEVAQRGADGLGWPALFRAAFRQSRNAMVLLDDQRRHVDFNGSYLRLVGYSRAALIGRPVFELVQGGPVTTPAEWTAALADGHFTGETRLIRADGALVAVQWAATTEMVTGRQLVLFVALSTSRWGRQFRRHPEAAGAAPSAVLSRREREVVHLVALGGTSSEIAAELHIAPDTVRTHVRNAMTKVGARSRAHLVAKALGDGLVPM